MKLVKPKFEIIEQPSGIEGIYKMVEIAGRTCYKSEDKITENSAKEFVQRMLKAGHLAMLEHGTVYMSIPIKEETSYRIDSYASNKYSRAKISSDCKKYYITTNLRVLVENGWIDDLKYLCEPTEYHEKRYCTRVICDRGVANEFVRHRTLSFAQESTRYCDYSKDKFSHQLTFIIPSWCDWEEGVTHINDCAKYGNGSEDSQVYLRLLAGVELSYFKLRDLGWKPQQARAVLTNSLKTELVMTGFASDWEHFFKLRCDEAAHPQAKELAIPLKEEFIKRGYISVNK